MIRRPTISTLTYTLYPYTTLFRSRQRLRGKFIFGKAGPGGCDHQPVKLRSGKGAARRTLERHLQRFAAASIGREAAKAPTIPRSEEHTSELQSLMRISYAVFCLKKKNKKQRQYQKYIKIYKN